MLLTSWCAGCAAILVCTASLTDLRWRRIPNGLTFPAIGLGLVLNLASAGWEGLLLSVIGALVAPCVLAFLHAGKGFGMGDLKLVAALGAVLGPVTGTIAVLVSALAGGVMAAVWLVRSRPRAVLNLLALLGLRAHAPAAPEPEQPAGKPTIPYGVAISVGTLVTVVVSLCTRDASWLF